MNRHARFFACAFILLPFATSAPASAKATAGEQDAKKWKPYKFVGNERFEYKVLMIEGDEKKESGFALDIRKKGEEDWDVTWSTKSTMKKTQSAELVMGGMVGMSPAMLLMNPLFGAFLEQVDLKEGEKMSLFGAGLVKVTKKETVGGRTGFICELYTKQEDKEVLTWACTVDPDLALPIRSITYDAGKEKSRMDLVTYHKD